MDSYCINLGRCDMFNVRRWDIFSFFQSMLITLNPINARAHPMSIYSGFLFDNKSIRTLSADGPVKHSVHCLLDVEQCVTSAYEVLNHLDNGDFGRSWQVSSNDKIIEYGKEFGGCGDCKQASGTEGFISTGMQATLTATLTALGDTNTPATIDVISVNDIDAFDIVCNATRVFVPPNGMVTTAGDTTQAPTKSPAAGGDGELTQAPTISPASPTSNPPHAMSSSASKSRHNIGLISAAVYIIALLRYVLHA